MPRISPGFLAALAMLVIPTQATAQDQTLPAIRAGTYIFSTFAQVDSRPVCTEFWTFEADGQMSVRSGEERVEKAWSLESDRDGNWLVMQLLSGNGAPDCMGNVTATYLQETQRTYYLVHNDGLIQLCPAPGHTEDGVPFIADCYARLVRAEDAG